MFDLRWFVLSQEGVSTSDMTCDHMLSMNHTVSSQKIAPTSLTTISFKPVANRCHNHNKLGEASGCRKETYKTIMSR